MTEQSSKRNLQQPKRKTKTGPGQSGPSSNRGDDEDFDVCAVPTELTSKKRDGNISMDGKVNIINQTDLNSECYCISYNEEYDKIAAGCQDGKLRLYHSGTDKLVSTLVDDDILSSLSSAPVTGVRHRPVSKNYPINNCLTCTYSNGYVKCWNYEFGQCVFTIKENRQTYGLTYHPRLPKFLTYGDDLKLYLYDEETKTQERILSKSENKELHDGPTSRVFAACFNPRSNYDLITGGWDDLVHFWDLRQPHAIRYISKVHMCGEGIDINSKGTEILTAAWQTENAMQLWDYASGKLIAEITGDIHKSKLYCGRFATKDYFVTGGCDPNLFRVVDMQTYVTVASILNLPGAITCIDLGPLKKSMVQDVKGMRKSDFSVMPKIAFAAGPKLFQIDFY